MRSFLKLHTLLPAVLENRHGVADATHVKIVELAKKSFTHLVDKHDVTELLKSHASHLHP